MCINNMHILHALQSHNHAFHVWINTLKINLINYAVRDMEEELNIQYPSNMLSLSKILL